MMDALTVFDAIAIALILVSMLMALSRGFMRELATLGAFLAAVAAAYYARKFLRGPVDDLLPADSKPWMPDAILFVGVFLLVYIIVAFIGAHLSRSIQGVDGVGLIDRLAGAVFGFARGAIVLIFFVFLIKLALEEDRIPDWIRQAGTYPILEEWAEELSDYAPTVAERTQGSSGNLDESGGAP